MKTIKVKINRQSSRIITSIIYIILGVLFVAFRSELLKWCLTIAGILFLGLALYDILKHNFVSGGLEIVIGAITILGGWFFIEFVLIVFGLLISLKGFYSLLDACKIRNVIDIIAASIFILIGILVALSHWLLLDWFFVVLGAVFVADGVLGLCGKRRS